MKSVTAYLREIYAIQIYFAIQKLQKWTKIPEITFFFHQVISISTFKSGNRSFSAQNEPAGLSQGWEAGITSFFVVLRSVNIYLLKCLQKNTYSHLTEGFSSCFDTQGFDTDK